MEEVRRVIDVRIGSEVENPKLSFDFSFVMNAFSVKNHLKCLPSFSDESAFFYLALRSDQPNELKVACQEFYEAYLNFAKELKPHIYENLSKMTVDFGIHDGLVLVGFNINDNEKMKGLAELAQGIAKETIAGEAKIKIGFLLNKSIKELLTSTEEDLESLQGNFHFIMESCKKDKYAVKKALLNLAPQKPDSEKDQFGRLLFLMFSAAEFHISSPDNFSFKEESTKEMVTKAREKVTANLNKMKANYESKKEKMEKFPFIENLVSALEHFGAGHATVGVYSQGIELEVEVTGSDLTHISHHIMGK